jgi:hypothetical protein
MEQIWDGFGEPLTFGLYGKVILLILCIELWGYVDIPLYPSALRRCRHERVEVVRWRARAEAKARGSEVDRFDAVPGHGGSDLAVHLQRKLELRYAGRDGDGEGRRSAGQGHTGGRGQHYHRPEVVLGLRRDE